MPFKPGQSGCPDGGRKQKLWRATLERAVLQDDGDRLRKAAEKLLTLASEGEQWAVKEIADRLDGKAAQEITGADGGPLEAVITWQSDNT